MKFLAGAFLLALALVASYAEVQVQDLSAFNYHMRIGIPEAARIKKAEEEAAKAGRAGQRIVGGAPVDISVVPYQVGLLVRITPTIISVCSGSLISNNRVITSAHCYSDGVIVGNHYTAVLGSNTLFTGGVRIQTNDLVVHPGWNLNTISNDIAVLRIPAITFTNVIRPIALPSGPELSQNFVGQTAFASGFGKTGDDIPANMSITNEVIHGVNLRVISNAECAAVFGSFIQSSNICTSGAGGVNICTGDNGGPLVANGVDSRILIGVTSFFETPCSDGLPSAYARVSSFVSWLRSV